MPDAPRCALWGGRGRTGRLCFGLVVLTVVTRALIAQTPAADRPPPSATALMPAATLAHHIGVLRADSLRGRATPSQALERTAQYLVREFQRLGLQPAQRRNGRYDGDSDSSRWFQRYPVPGQQRLSYGRSRVVFGLPTLRYEGVPIVTEVGEALKRQTVATFRSEAHFVREVGPPAVVAPMSVGRSFEVMLMGSDQAALVSGRQTSTSLRQAALRAQVVIYVPPVGLADAHRQEVLRYLYQTTQGVVVIGEADSARFAAARRRAHRQPVPLFEGFLRDPLGRDHWPWAVAVWPPALRGILGAAGVDLAKARADTTPRVRALPSLHIALIPTADTTSQVQRTAPNVMAWLAGSDAALKHEVVVIAARMDGPGARPGRADSLTQRGHDNAGGIAALLALAKAFSQPEARPRRSVLFLAVSGGAKKELWGSRFFLAHSNLWWQLGLDHHDLVANLTLDLSGRPGSDSVTVDGVGNFDHLALPPAWAAATYPELDLTVVEGGALQRLADPFPFTRYRVPSLSFHNRGAGTPPDGRDEPGVVDAERAARIGRLVFSVGQAIANADQRPQWRRRGR